MAAFTDLTVWGRQLRGEEQDQSVRRPKPLRSVSAGLGRLPLPRLSCGKYCGRVRGVAVCLASRTLS